MKRTIKTLGFVAAGILAGGIASAQAEEPVLLTDAEMDGVTAGYGSYYYPTPYTSYISRYVTILRQAPLYGTPFFGCSVGRCGYSGMNISPLIGQPWKFDINY